MDTSQMPVRAYIRREIGHQVRMLGIRCGYRRWADSQRHPRFVRRVRFALDHGLNRLGWWINVSRCERCHYYSRQITDRNGRCPACGKEQRR